MQPPTPPRRSPRRRLPGSRWRTPSARAPQQAEAERAAAEQAAAERAEAERVAAEQAAAEQAAIRQAEAERVEAERVEAERLEAERLEAERAAVERAEADQAAAAAAAELAAGLAAAMADVPEQAVREDNPYGAAHASSLLTEFNREPSSTAASVAEEPEEAPVPVDVQAETDTGPAPMVTRDHADTAMLLRELASLGFGADEEPPRAEGAGTPAADLRSAHRPEEEAQGLVRPRLIAALPGWEHGRVRAVVQRVRLRGVRDGRRAGHRRGSTSRGLFVLVGVTHDDTERRAQARRQAVGLRFLHGEQSASERLGRRSSSSASSPSTATREGPAAHLAGRGAGTRRRTLGAGVRGATRARRARRDRTVRRRHAGRPRQRRPGHAARGGVTTMSDEERVLSAETSAVIVPVPEAELLVAAHRRLLDPAGAWGVPAHVTLLFPFVPPAQVDDEVLTRLADAVQSVAAFDCVFAHTEWFGDEVVWLAPEPDEPFRRLTARIWEVFPEHPPYAGALPDPTPHLTVGGPIRDAAAAMLAAEAAVRVGLPVHTRVERALLMAGTRAPDSWRVRTSCRSAVSRRGRRPLAPRRRRRPPGSRRAGSTA